jgi:colanic acid/amylovoran biosynthesis glycosyltransferase
MNPTRQAWQEGRISADGEGPVLALVSPSFGQVSETFIADHVRRLAPGRTVLVCQDGRGAEGFGYPVLAALDSETARLGGGLSPLGRLQVDLSRRLRRRRGHGPMLSAADRARLAGFLEAQGVTVVLAEFGYSGAAVMETCKTLEIPLHVYFRGHDATRHVVHRSLVTRYRRLFAHAASVICVSRHIADRLREIGCPDHLLHVVPSGVEPDLFPPGRPEAGRILAVGRLVEMKSPDRTIEAFARIAGRFPEARLDMVGEGPLRPRCEALVAGYGLGDRVTLHGAQPHAVVAALTARAAFFVQHSVTTEDGFIEGFPTAIAEAMCAGLPIVATRHSGIPEHVKDGENGLLVAEGDVAAMAEAMARLLAEPGTARRMGEAARAHALAHLDRRRSRARVRAILGLPAIAGEETDEMPAPPARAAAGGPT